MRQEDVTTPAGHDQGQRWPRRQIAAIVQAWEQADQSERAFAPTVAVPRSTLGHWRRQQDRADVPAPVATFFQSPEGLEWLHRIVTALHLVFDQQGSCGLRRLVQFLRLTQLDQFVAASFGSQQRLAHQLEEAIVQYGQRERVRLAATMPPRRISVCEDETFHPTICLVAIEPVADFILLEAYEESRSAAHWTTAMQQATADLNVTIVQVTSDEAPGLLAHTRSDLGAHHSPDTFHIQQEAGRGLHGPLQSQVRSAEKAYFAAVAQRETLERQRAASAVGPRPVGRPPDFETQVRAAQQKEQQAEAVLEAACLRQSDAQAALRGIADDYHPYDLATGQPVERATLRRKLGRRFDQLATLAAAAGLSDSSQRHLAKARRVLPAMLATLSWFWLRVRTRLQELHLSAAVERVVRRDLLPGLYLAREARKARTTTQRTQLRQRAERLLRRAQAPTSPLGRLDPAVRAQVEAAALECVQSFQRSSSCVEGRNGHLAFHHHALHRLGSRRLAVLTTLHNYYTSAREGKTPAERFFGAPPADLFTYLLQKLPPPPAPRKRRTAPKQLAA